MHTKIIFIEEKRVRRCRRCQVMMVMVIVMVMVMVVVMVIIVVGGRVGDDAISIVSQVRTPLSRNPNNASGPHRPKAAS